jgi:hypothetical protein
MDYPTSVTKINGIVGFFDILGYASFMEQNSDIDAITNVFQIINGIRPEMKKVLHQSFNRLTEAEDDPVIKFVDELRLVVFSDTILVIAKFPENDVGRATYTLTHVIACAILSHRMFENGLPLRGSINTGEIFLQENCFAGQAIIAAYNDSRELNLAATIVHDDVLKAFDRFPADWQRTNVLVSHFVQKYPAPLKGGRSARAKLLNFVGIYERDLKMSPDVRQWVARAFWGHKKEVTPDVYEKLFNTEMFCRFLIEYAPRNPIADNG